MSARSSTVASVVRLAFVPLLALVLGVSTPSTQLDAQQRAATAQATSHAEFARLVAALSEPGGYFDTDNLISNEKGYLHVVGALQRRGVRGGAYIGVGPDQNFSYIARVRPSIAFVIDIRRDNLLQHLLFKALFARARNRAEYLALLLGRPVPPEVAKWAERDVDAIVAYMDATASTPASARAARAAVLAEVQRYEVPLSAADLATIGRFHGEFIEKGLGLQFTSTGRAPRPYYPTLRQLVQERDLDGRQASYLAREADFQFVKDLERRDLVIPVVGDLAGDHALAAIGRLVTQRGERVSAFYTSNVEDYLLRDGSFARYARGVAGLPRDARSVIIRSWFGGNFGQVHPQSVTGYFSTQLLQSMDAFVKATGTPNGGFTTYRELVFSEHLPLK
jgi:hypothetical protein